MDHDTYIYGVNAGFAELTAKNSLKSIQGIPVLIPEQERERLACVLIDVMNDHQAASGNLLDPIDYYNAAHRLNLLLGTAYFYNFLA